MNTYTITYTVTHNGQLEDYTKTVRFQGDRKALYLLIKKQIEDIAYHSFTTSKGEYVYPSKEILSFVVKEAPPSKTSMIIYE